MCFDIIDRQVKVELTTFSEESAPSYHLNITPPGKQAGSPEPITNHSGGRFAGRFLSITVKFQGYENNGKRIKGAFLKLALTSVYHHCRDDAKHENFITTLNACLTQIPNNAEGVMGADVNARIGRREGELYEEALGPHGFDSRNTQ